MVLPSPPDAPEDNWIPWETVVEIAGVTPQEAAVDMQTGKLPAPGKFVPRHGQRRKQPLWWRPSVELNVRQFRIQRGSQAQG